MQIFVETVTGLATSLGESLKFNSGVDLSIIFQVLHCDLSLMSLRLVQFRGIPFKFVNVGYQ